jgi:hypothetical protein
MVSDILIGVAVLLVGFAISFALYIYDKKRESLGKNDIQK